MYRLYKFGDTLLPELISSSARDGGISSAFAPLTNLPNGQVFSHITRAQQARPTPEPITHSGWIHRRDMTAAIGELNEQYGTVQRLYRQWYNGRIEWIDARMVEAPRQSVYAPRAQEVAYVFQPLGNEWSGDYRRIVHQFSATNGTLESVQLPNTGDARVYDVTIEFTVNDVGSQASITDVEISATADSVEPVSWKVYDDGRTVPTGTEVRLDLTIDTGDRAIIGPDDGVTVPEDNVYGELIYGAAHGSDYLLTVPPGGYTGDDFQIAIDCNGGATVTISYYEAWS